MEKLIDINHLTTNPSYSPTKWVDNAQPALNADNLNKIETAIMTNRVAENNIIGEVNKTQANNEALQKNIKDVNDTVNSLTLSNINDQSTDTIILDGGEQK